jgi:hypothetical protein
MQALILAAETGGPTMFARIGIIRSLNRRTATASRRKGARSTGSSNEERPHSRARMMGDFAFCEIHPALTESR